jgi:glycosyltransferase involved in cell wall biosynthesis
MIELSVVVATYCRRDVLRVTLQKLAEQSCPADCYEVIVVDDGSEDGTREMAEAMASKVPFALTYLWHRNRGPGASENRGIRAARGRIIVLMADDIHPAPRMLASHARFHAERPEANVAALGRVLQSPDLPQTVFQSNWDPFKYYELDGSVELPYWKFWACNISVKRQFMLDHGMFQELKGAAHEDVELGYRLSRAGLRIFYNPEALAHHYHLETLAAAARRAYERGLNWTFIEQNVPDPQIHVKYHILNRRTLRHHYDTFRNLAATSLPPEDRNLPWLLFRQVVRWAVFNRWTVPGIWMGLLARAEDSRLLQRIVHPYMYRGTVFYHFVKGCADVARRAQTAAAAAWPGTSDARASLEIAAPSPSSNQNRK